MARKLESMGLEAMVFPWEGGGRGANDDRRVEMEGRERWKGNAKEGKEGGNSSRSQ
jgi:hypothetical protein